MTTTNVLILAVCLFFVGLFGVLARRNILIIMMSIELMLNAANLAFVTFARDLQDVGGQMAVFFIITVGGGRGSRWLGAFDRGLPPI